MRYSILYNGVTDLEVGCHAARRPSVAAPARKVTAYTIAGRDGALYEHDSAYDDITIGVEFGFNTRSPDKWAEAYRGIKAWLLSEGNGELSFSDDEECFYKVKNVAISSSERLSKRIGVVTASFTCQGYTYLYSGKRSFPLREIVTNRYALSHPVYVITGNGTATLTVNGKNFVINVGGSITIDTDRMLAIGPNSAWANTAVSGDYEDLYLLPGNNTLSITSGFECQITPNWRCL